MFSCLLLSSLIRPTPSFTLFPYTTLFRSRRANLSLQCTAEVACAARRATRLPPGTPPLRTPCVCRLASEACRVAGERSEEHTSELQSLTNLVCRLLLEKKKQKLS